MPAIFIDTNTAIYAAGAPHPYKEPAARVIDLVWQKANLFVTDTEVLQEILHRYVSIGRWGQGRRVFEEFSAVTEDRIEPILTEDVKLAAKLVDDHHRLSARDLIHLAVMQRLGVTRIVTADGGFKNLPGIERLDPADIEKWRGSVG